MYRNYDKNVTVDLDGYYSVSDLNKPLSQVNIKNRPYSLMEGFFNEKLVLNAELTKNLFNSGIVPKLSIFNKRKEELAANYEILYSFGDSFEPTYYDFNIIPDTKGKYTDQDSKTITKWFNESNYYPVLKSVNSLNLKFYFSEGKDRTGYFKLLDFDLYNKFQKGSYFAKNRIDNMTFNNVVANDGHDRGEMLGKFVSNWNYPIYGTTPWFSSSNVSTYGTYIPESQVLPPFIRSQIDNSVYMPMTTMNNDFIKDGSSANYSIANVPSSSLFLLPVNGKITINGTEYENNFFDENGLPKNKSFIPVEFCPVMQFQNSCQNYQFNEQTGNYDKTDRVFDFSFKQMPFYCDTIKGTGFEGLEFRLVLDKSSIGSTWQKVGVNVIDDFITSVNNMTNDSSNIFNNNIMVAKNKDMWKQYYEQSGVKYKYFNIEDFDSSKYYIGYLSDEVNKEINSSLSITNYGTKLPEWHKYGDDWEYAVWNLYEVYINRNQYRKFQYVDRYMGDATKFMNFAYRESLYYPMLALPSYDIKYRDFEQVMLKLTPYFNNDLYQYMAGNYKYSAIIKDDTYWTNSGYSYTNGRVRNLGVFDKNTNELIGIFSTDQILLTNVTIPLNNSLSVKKTRVSSNGLQNYSQLVYSEDDYVNIKLKTEYYANQLKYADNQAFDDNFLQLSDGIIDDETSQLLSNTMFESALGLNELSTNIDVINRVGQIDKITQGNNLLREGEDQEKIKNDYLNFKQSFLDTFVEDNSPAGLIGLLRVLTSDSDERYNILNYMNLNNNFTIDQAKVYAMMYMSEISTLANYAIDTLPDAIDIQNEFSVINNVLSGAMSDSIDDLVKFINDNKADDSKYNEIVQKFNETVSNIVDSLQTSLEQYTNSMIPINTQALLDSKFYKSYDNLVALRTHDKITNLAGALITTSSSDLTYALQTFSKYVKNRADTAGNSKLLRAAASLTTKLDAAISGISDFVVDGLSNIATCVGNIIKSSISSVAKTVSFIDNIYNLKNIDYLLLSSISRPLSNTPSIINSADYILKNQNNLKVYDYSGTSFSDYLQWINKDEAINMDDSFNNAKIGPGSNILLFDKNSTHAAIYIKGYNAYLLPNLHAEKLSQYSMPGEVVCKYMSQISRNNVGDTLSPYPRMTEGEISFYSGIIIGGSALAFSAAALAAGYSAFGIANLIAGTTAAAATAVTNGISLASIVSRANSKTSVYDYVPNISNIYSNFKSYIDSINSEEGNKLMMISINTDIDIIDCLSKPSELKKSIFTIKNIIGIVGGLAFSTIATFAAIKLGRGIKNWVTKRRYTAKARLNDSSLERFQAKKVAARELGINTSTSAVVTATSSTASLITKAMSFTSGLVTGSLSTITNLLKKNGVNDTKEPTADTEDKDSSNISSILDLSSKVIGIVEKTNENTIVTNKLLR